MKKLVNVVIVLGLVLSAHAVKVKKCGHDHNESYVDINSIDVEADKLSFPGKISLGVDLDVSRDLKGAQIELEVTFKRKVAWIWITIPCIRGVGSCTYDVCKLVRDLTEDGCPDDLTSNGIPCECDKVKKGSYTLPQQVVELPDLPGVMSYLSEGKYKIGLKIRDKAADKDLACLSVEATIDN
ncbi:actin-1/3 [Plakobranchus ocellatus]|uniref:Actin-1/3 n=1 Tax=Plakobranchus ocellatus TaxID=259542 RepID=A0AAV4APB5_9GAST|nr:actin-1/3 [Plakobranchus ocellatus]